MNDDEQIATEKVVTKPLKVDLHIHSAASKHKDGALVANGTIDNLPVLIEALERDEVNMVAITDHDCFNYEMYSTLRSKVKDSSSLIKVFPGVEFTVMFTAEGVVKPIHIVTIFDDANEDAIRSIVDKIPWKDTCPDYDANNAFTESKYWEIIRSIGVDVVVIAHQKNSPGSKKPRSNDASCLGSDVFNDFLFLDYFEAYEYKNQRNELFNNAWKFTNDQMESLRFITGSDCHQWNVYPDYKQGEHVEFKHTYLKCLPTFKGLAMAITDVGRIKTVGSFFSPSAIYVQSIDITIGGNPLSIPLSPGINAIIGDNSIGKSCLINALTDFRDVNKKTTRDGYEKYLKKIGVELLSVIPDQDVATMDGQSAIRQKLEDLGASKAKAKSKLGEHFSENPAIATVLQYAKNQIDLYIAAVRASCRYRKKVDELASFDIPDPGSIETTDNLSILSNLTKGNFDEENSLLGDVKRVKVQVDQLSTMHDNVLTGEDKKDLDLVAKALGRISSRHSDMVNKTILENRVINVIAVQANELRRKIAASATDSQKIASTYLAAKADAIEAILDVIQREFAVKDFEFSPGVRRVEPVTNPVGSYQFITRAKTEEVTPVYLYGLIARVLLSKKSIDVRNATYEDVRNATARYPEDDEGDPVEILGNKLYSEVEKDFDEDRAILRENDDVYGRLSEGFNARIYFSLMADETLGRGLYIVDQPEDQISQKSIRDSVLHDFRDIAQARQVILITHNPQFIVNLDVDNVVFIKRSGETVEIKSGALEYDGDGYRILDLVADNVEGGLDTIRRRMKRYEKTS